MRRATTFVPPGGERLWVSAERLASAVRFVEELVEALHEATPEWVRP